MASTDCTLLFAVIFILENIFVAEITRTTFVSTIHLNLLQWKQILFQSEIEDFCVGKAGREWPIDPNNVASLNTKSNLITIT